MYRYRIHVQVRYGRFKEHLEVCERLNELARSRGWTESTFWVPTVGTGNEVIIETDYPDLATFQREGDAFSSDPEAMKLLRSTSELIVEGSARSELLETAPALA
jgi:NIPSNAP